MNTAPLAYEHNGERTDRAAFYAIACDPRRSVAVEACAGAGKTWMLVSRILRALLEGAQPHEILAITFTKKAAGEMRQRLHEWLEQFAQATPEVLQNELHIRGIAPEAAHSLVEPLSQLYQTVLAAGRPVQVRTFHSWFAALLRSAPLAVLGELGLPTHYRAAGRRHRGGAGRVAALLHRCGTRQRRAGRLSGRRGHPRPLPDAEGAARRAGQAGGICTGRCGRRGRRVGSALGTVFTEFSGLDHPNDMLAGDDSTGPRTLLWAAARALGRASARTFAEKGRELEQALTGHDADAMLAALLTQKGEPRKFSDKLADIATAPCPSCSACSTARRQHEACVTPAAHGPAGALPDRAVC